MTNPGGLKPLEYTATFQKHLVKRFRHQPKVIVEVRRRLKLFNEGVRGEPLNDHALRGEFKKYRAISVSGDIRIVYEETETAYVLHDIGTHSQVY